MTNSKAIDYSQYSKKARTCPCCGKVTQSVRILPTGAVVASCYRKHCNKPCKSKWQIGEWHDFSKWKRKKTTKRALPLRTANAGIKIHKNCKNAKAPAVFNDDGTVTRACMRAECNNRLTKKQGSGVTYCCEACRLARSSGMAGSLLL